MVDHLADVLTHHSLLKQTSLEVTLLHEATVKNLCYHLASSTWLVQFSPSQRLKPYLKLKTSSTIWWLRKLHLPFSRHWLPNLLFFFLTNLFGKVTDAYKTIEQHLGETDGLRNLSKYESQRSTQLIVVARFRQAEDSRKVLSEGFVYNNMTFKVAPSMVHTERSLVRLQLTLLHIPSKATFLEDLLSSLKYCGKVCQVKQRLHEGYFEGELSVLLDIFSPSLDEQSIPLPIQALQRNLYLEAWDTFAHIIIPA